MLKYLVLLVLMSTTYVSSQEQHEYLDGIFQSHVIFKKWDMDKYRYKYSYSDWHDMDFVCDPESQYDDYHWKLTLSNGSNSISTKIIKLSKETNKVIYPYWDTNYDSGENFLHLPDHFDPTNYTINFYNENKNPTTNFDFLIYGQSSFTY